MLDIHRLPVTQSQEKRDPVQNEISVGSLTTSAVSADGRYVRLNFEDAAGRPAKMTLTSTDVQKLVMTLPQLLSRALQIQHADATVRAVFPLGRWRIETSAASADFIFTMMTPDGFEVAFALCAPTVAEIASALGSAAVQGASSRVS
jgi:hypothetical protein